MLVLSCFVNNTNITKQLNTNNNMTKTKIKKYNLEVSKRSTFETGYMTIAELVKYFGYTLECGRSWNNKVKPKEDIKTIKQLLRNLELSYDEIEGGFTRTSVSLLDEKIENIEN